MRLLFSIFTALSIGGSSLEAVPLGDLGLANGVTGPDYNPVGPGYLLFNPNGLGENRLYNQPNDAPNFSVVTYEAGAWFYFINETKLPFFSDPSDLLVASIDFPSDTANLLVGENFVVEGIRAGYQAGDLVVTPNFWNGGGNPGEFGLTGTEITLNVDPAWWTEGDPVIVPNVPNVDHKAAANLGQAKWMAKRAYDTILEQNPTLAAAILAELVGDPATHPFSEWEPAVAPDGGDRAALLLGQLKAIAAPFYNQLNQAAPVWLEAEMIRNGTRQPNSHLPWGPDVGANENRAAANIGQLKALFSLSLSSIKESDLDADQDGIPDSLEQQIIAASGGAYTNLADINPDDDLDGDYLPNLNEILNGEDPLSPSGGNTYTPIQWRDFYYTASSDSSYGSSLTKDTATAWAWESGAKSVQLMPADGGISFQLPPQEGHYAMCGLTSYDSEPNFYDLDHTFYRYGQNVAIFEKGRAKYYMGARGSNATFGIRRTGTVVTYYINNLLVYTSVSVSEKPLFADSSFLKIGSQITHAGQYGFSNGDIDQDGLPDVWELAHAPNLDVLSPGDDHDRDFHTTATEYRHDGDPFEPLAGSSLALPVVWEDSTSVASGFNPETATGSIVRTASYNGWNAGIHSAGYINGDGSVLFRIGESEIRHGSMVGLSAASSTNSYLEINHAIFIHGVNAWCYENGVSAAYLGSAGPDDVFEVRRAGINIEYLKNGVVKYTSNLTTSAPLLIDTSILMSGLSIDHIASIGMTYDSGNEDTDADGLPLWLETLAGLSDSNPDQDGDGLLDGAEIFFHRSNPFSQDSDDDGLLDSWELSFGLKPFDPTDSSDLAPDHDFDGDGVLTFYEIHDGTDPTDASDFTNIPREGMMAWLDGSTLTGNDGSPVNLWSDRSLEGRNATAIDNSPAVVSVNPDNSRKSLDFSPAETATYTLPISGTIPRFTISWTMNPRSAFNYNQGIGAHWGFFIFHTANGGSVYAGTDVSTRFTPSQLGAGTLELDVWQQFTFTYADGVGRFYKNGLLLAEKSGMNDPNPWPYMRLFSSLDGEVGSLLFYDRSLTALEVSDLQNHYERSTLLEADSDGDGLPDVWERAAIIASNGDLSTLSEVDPAGDLDDDGQTNLQEFEAGTGPVDTDNDGLSNYLEIEIGTDPHDSDTDDDYVPDGIEYYGQ